MPDETPDVPDPRRTRVLVIAAAVGAVVVTIVAILVLASGGSNSGGGAVSGVRHVGDLGEIGATDTPSKALDSALEGDGSVKVSGAERRDIVGCVDSLGESLAPSRRDQLRLELTGLASHKGVPAIVLGYRVEGGAGKGGLQVFVLQRAGCGIVETRLLFSSGS